jgi:hypothetical protein
MKAIFLPEQALFTLTYYIIWKSDVHIFGILNYMTMGIKK